MNTSLSKKIVVTGGAGFLGQHVIANLKERGYSNIFTPLSSEFDLRVRGNCEKIVQDADIVIHLAAQIGGIGFIQERPGEIFYNNIIMGVELMEASRKMGVKKYVSIGTVCEYPQVIPMPFKEEDLWKGYPEEVTAPYGWAKKMAIVQGKAYWQQYHFKAIHLIPVNLYGPGDNFDKASAHVIPALIRKVLEAKRANSPTVSIWGSGKATREFLYVEDAADGIVLATDNYDQIEPINLGTGEETSIRQVTETIMELLNFKGSIVWDTSKPDGQPRRQISVEKAKQFGFEAKVSLKDGLTKTIEWYLKNEK